MASRDPGEAAAAFWLIVIVVADFMGKRIADSIVSCIFDEIQALWDELGTVPPAVAVAGGSAAGGDGLERCHPDGSILNIWLFDDHGVRLAPLLRREPHIFGETRDGFSRYGLVKFAIDPDRDRVTLEFRLGPGIGGEIHYDVEEADGKVRLVANSGTLA